MGYPSDPAESPAKPRPSEVAAASSLFPAPEGPSLCPLTGSAKLFGPSGSSTPSLAQSLLRHGNATVSTVFPSSASIDAPAPPLASIRALPNISSAFVPAQSGSSQLFPNPSQPAPIPATRFDTVTSYIDLVYQQQQLNQQAAPEPSDGSERAREGSAPGGASSARTRRRSTPADGARTPPGNVIYLSPCDGIDGDSSFMATCPCCAMMVMTDTEPFLGRGSFRAACCLAPALLCWLPLSGARFGRRWMDVRHSCPHCHGLVAIYRKQ